MSTLNSLTATAALQHLSFTQKSVAANNQDFGLAFALFERAWLTQRVLGTFAAGSSIDGGAGRAALLVDRSTRRIQQRGTSTTSWSSENGGGLSARMWLFPQPESS